MGCSRVLRVYLQHTQSTALADAGDADGDAGGETDGASLLTGSPLPVSPVPASLLSLPGSLSAPPPPEEPVAEVLAAFLLSVIYQPLPLK